jgi:hypothetical protein
MSSKKTNTTTPLEEVAAKDKGRKPYYVGKESGDLTHTEALHGGGEGGTYPTMMARANYSYSKQAQLQHSAFKKPYAGDEFPEMEGFGDDLQLMGFEPWDITLDGDTAPGEVGGTTGGSGGDCMVVCNENFYLTEWSDDCTEFTIRFKGDFEAEPGEDPETVPLTYSDNNREGIHRGTGNNWYPVSVNIGGGGAAGVMRRSTESFSNYAGRWDQAYIVEGIDPAIIQAAIGLFQQDLQAWCSSVMARCEITINEPHDCDVCALEWDLASSDDTVTQLQSPPDGEHEADIYVVGGEDTYSWSISLANGSGLTLADATTAVPNNTVIADASACGSAVITVTSCGSSTEGSVRVTDAGVWCTTCTRTTTDECPWPYDPTNTTCIIGADTEDQYVGGLWYSEGVNTYDTDIGQNCPWSRCDLGYTTDKDFYMHQVDYANGCCQVGPYATCSRVTARSIKTRKCSC